MSPVTTLLQSPAKQHRADTWFEVGLLTGCQDRQYAFGLAMALAAKGVAVDLIGSDEIDSPELHGTPRLRFLNFRGSQLPRAGVAAKLRGLLGYYLRLLRYAGGSKPKILHILWNNKFEYFDRTLLLLYYKVWGKKIAFTAHNVNQRSRDGNDSLLNRLTLKVQYQLADHIFVHTIKMKDELQKHFGVRAGAVTVIRYPVNNALPHTGLTSAGAKQRLGLKGGEKSILFFGRIRPYKGLENLVTAFRQLADRHPDYRLIIASEPKKGSEDYLAAIRATIKDEFASGLIVSRIQYIPDDDVELYMKAADVMVLPYKNIFQSGVLFLAYSFGLPVIATDVGSFREDIIEGRTGFLCKSSVPVDLAHSIETYFNSGLYRNLDESRAAIRDYVTSHHSWEAAANLTCTAYAEMSGGQSS